MFGGGVNIGRFCSISSDVHYVGDNHPMTYISTSPLLYGNGFLKNINQPKAPKHGKLHIGNDVWIGRGVTILAGCKNIGNGAVIGAESVVTKDIPAYAVVVGNPAKVIKYRFTPNVITKIEKSQWWEKDLNQLSTINEYINNPLSFLKELNKL